MILIGSASNYYIGGNDEHGMNPPTAGKRTPVMPYIGRSFYENEFNRPTKDYFLAACMRCGFSVFDVKPEITDTSIATRVARTNNQGLTLVMTFAYNAYGTGLTFNAANGYQVFYSAQNIKPTASRSLSIGVDSEVRPRIPLRSRGVETLSGISMLSSVRCTSSLIEGGFMTNFDEAKLMMDPDFQRAVAEGCTNGVCDFLGKPYTAQLNPSSLPLIKRGSYNMYVKYLQLLLRTYGYNTVTADGSFGALTESAVKSYQGDNGLTADGIVGNNTWTSLIVNQSPPPTLRRRSRGKYVRYLQQKLLSKLYTVGTIDGAFGSQTEDALKQFQSENGLTADGIAGRLTWAKIQVMGGGRPLP